jgi:hypothetical protein
VQRQRPDLFRVFGRQPHPGRRAERQSEYVRAADPGRLHEPGDVVGEKLRGVDAVRLGGQAGAAQVHAVAGEMLGVLGNLERIAGLVGSKVWNEHKRLAVTLNLVINVDPVGLNDWHASSFK